MSKAAYKYPPYPGERWQTRKPHETRDVVDRTFGGDVIFVWPRKYGRTTVSLAEWFEWEHTAKIIITAEPPLWAR